MVRSGFQAYRSHIGKIGVVLRGAGGKSKLRELLVKNRISLGDILNNSAVSEHEKKRICAILALEESKRVR